MEQEEEILRQIEELALQKTYGFKKYDYESEDSESS